MKLLLLVGAGGFAGSIARYALSRTVESQLLSSFPWGTFAVNIIGCFVIGLIYGFAVKNLMSPEWRLLLATGFCGGFTTFSSFSYETMTLLQDGQLWYVGWYVGGSVIVGLIAVITALWITQQF